MGKFSFANCKKKVDVKTDNKYIEFDCLSNRFTEIFNKSLNPAQEGKDQFKETHMDYTKALKFEAMDRRSTESSANLMQRIIRIVSTVKCSLDSFLRCVKQKIALEALTKHDIKDLKDVKVPNLVISLELALEEFKKQIRHGRGYIKIDNSQQKESIAMIIAGDMELKLNEIEDGIRTFESEFDNVMELLFSTLENLVEKKFLVQSYLNQFEKSTTINFEISDDEDLEFETYEDCVANREKVRALAKIKAKNISDDGSNEDAEGQAEVIK